MLLLIYYNYYSLSCLIIHIINACHFLYFAYVYICFVYRYLDHIRPEKPIERAGGYTRKYPCLRAIQEAFDMLLFVKETEKESNDKTESMESLFQILLNSVLANRSTIKFCTISLPK